MIVENNNLPGMDVRHIEQCNWPDHIAMYSWPEFVDIEPIPETVAIWHVKYKQPC